MFVYVCLGILFLSTVIFAYFAVRFHTNEKRRLSALDSAGVPVAFFKGGKCFYLNETAKRLANGSENDSYSLLSDKFTKAGYKPTAEKTSNTGYQALMGMDSAEIEKANTVYKKEIFWLTSILDALPTPLSVTDKDMNWTFVNKVVEDMLNVKRKDIIGKHCSNWGAGICNTEDCGVKRLYKGLHETMFTQFGGDFQVTSNYLYDEKGEIDGHIEVVRDITDLTKKTREADELAYWYKSILDAVPSPLSVTDVDMKWTFINKATEKALGKTREEVLNKHCSNWGANICNTENCGIALFKRGKTSTAFSQAGMDFKVQTASLADSSGQLKGYVEIVENVTDVNALAKRAEDMAKNMITNLRLTSEKLSNDSRQVAESSQTLAAGFQQQNAQIQVLNNNVDNISKKINANAENSEKASNLANKAKQNALKGTSDMKEMLTSMEGIKEASTNISKIIMTIEEIAFQTNLLALNAAVEAARAGEHGKGFMVVAEEVRNLAARSSEAARMTNDLITDSLGRVENGTKTAQGTAESLNKTVTDFEQVFQIVGQIASASIEQSQLASELNNGIGQFAIVADKSSATIQDLAASSQELASHAEALNHMTV
jgi:methyl-accepting chemotaxis protein